MSQRHIVERSKIVISMIMAQVRDAASNSSFEQYLDFGKGKKHVFSTHRKTLVYWNVDHFH